MSYYIISQSLLIKLSIEWLHYQSRFITLSEFYYIITLYKHAIPVGIRSIMLPPLGCHICFIIYLTNPNWVKYQWTQQLICTGKMHMLFSLHCYQQDNSLLTTGWIDNQKIQIHLPLYHWEEPKRLTMTSISKLTSY